MASWAKSSSAAWAVAFVSEGRGPGTSTRGSGVVASWLQVALLGSAPKAAVSREMFDTFGELAEVGFDDERGVGEERLFFEIFHGRIDNEGS